MPADAPPPRTAPPAALVDGGRYRFGTYDGPIPTINPLDAAGLAGSGAGTTVARIRRDLQLKEWEAFQLGDDDHFVLGAVYDAKAMGILQVLVVDKHRSSITRWEAKLPSPRVHVARGVTGTRSHGRAGSFSIAISNELATGRLRIDASHPGRRALEPLELHGDGRCGPDDAGHLVVVHPFVHDRPSQPRALYSHKVMMPFDGTLRIGGDTVGLEPEHGFLILDDHHGDYPRPMRYDWVTAARRAPDGRVEGFNLTHNQMRDPDVHNENAVWLGATVHRLPTIVVDRPDGPDGRWHIHDRDGAVDVRFTPTVRSTMHIGPRHLIAEYFAPYGWFEGCIDAGGTPLVVDGMFGVGEQKLVRV